MKKDWIKIASLLFFCGAVAIGCDSDNSDDDKTNEETSSEATQLKVTVKESSNTGAILSIESNGDWSVESDRSWCVASEASGSGDQEIEVTYSTNSGAYDRNASLFFECEAPTSIMLSQDAGVYSPGMHYDIPIVFHIFYNNPENTQHNIDSDYIYEIFNYVKETYDNCDTDLGFTFVLAEENAEGETITEKGINRVEWEIAKIDYQDFMYGAYNRFADIMWDPSKFINIAIYEFGGALVAPQGMSQQAYLLAPDELEGTINLNDYVDPDELQFPMCASINNAYIFGDGSFESEFCSGKVTVAHELGHLFGLKHVFYEDGASTSGYSDTDLCSDTETYNRAVYVADIFTPIYESCLAAGKCSEEQLLELETRLEGKSSNEYISTNIMDYAVTRSTQFSPDQLTRMRYVLENSPLLPGCKARDFASMRTKSESFDSTPIPVKPIECNK